MDFEGLVRAVKPGDNIYLNDGYVQLCVERVTLDAVYTQVVAGGELRSNKGVNFPGIDLGISAFTPRDHELLAFAAAENLEAVSQSFVSGPEDIVAVRTAAQALGYDPLIIAKIERAAAVKHIDAILQVAQGIMVARGDLGVEIPVEEVAAAQKHIILRAKLAARPTITATQMLESMTHNRRPTRAEVSDVTNAILDGSDAVMLSGETAVGEYPDEAVQHDGPHRTGGRAHPRPVDHPGIVRGRAQGQGALAGRSCLAQHLHDRADHAAGPHLCGDGYRRHGTAYGAVSAAELARSVQP